MFGNIFKIQLTLSINLFNGTNIVFYNRFHSWSELLDCTLYNSHVTAAAPYTANVLLQFLQVSKWCQLFCTKKLTPFRDLEELKQKICSVWRSCCDMAVVQHAIKQFRPRVKSVIENNVGPIKQIYG